MKVLKSLALLCMAAVISLLVACDGADANNNVLRIGIAFDEASPTATSTNQRFIEGLEEATGRRVEIIEDVTYLIGIEAMRSGNLDMMFASSFNYVHASQVVDVEILATLSAPGTVTYFITHVDSGIYTMEDFENRTFAFVNESSTSGFLFPAYDLINRFNLDATQIALPGHFFSTVVMTGTHDNSVIGVYNGDFDGAAIATISLDNLANTGVINRDDIRVVGSTREHPAVSYIARAELGTELLEDIRAFLLGYDDPEFFAIFAGAALANPENRFIDPDVEGYNYVRSLARTLGIID